MSCDIILIGLVGVVLGFTGRRSVVGWLVGPTCPECRQARLRRIRELGEAWGTSTRFSTCPACNRHFRHDDAAVTATSANPQVTSIPPPR